MNFRESMRRLGILLGACGAVLGGFLGYSDAKAVWDRYTAHRRFESKFGEQRPRSRQQESQNREIFGTKPPTCLRRTRL
jgi:hypothetical protein